MVPSFLTSLLPLVHFQQVLIAKTMYIAIYTTTIMKLLSKRILKFSSNEYSPLLLSIDTCSTFSPSNCFQLQRTVCHILSMSLTNHIAGFKHAQVISDITMYPLIFPKIYFSHYIIHPSKQHDHPTESGRDLTTNPQCVFRRKNRWNPRRWQGNWIGNGNGDNIPSFNTTHCSGVHIG